MIFRKILAEIQNPSRRSRIRAAESWRKSFFKFLQRIFKESSKNIQRIFKDFDQKHCVFACKTRVSSKFLHQSFFRESSKNLHPVFRKFSAGFRFSSLGFRFLVFFRRRTFSRKIFKFFKDFSDFLVSMLYKPIMGPERPQFEHGVARPKTSTYAGATSSSRSHVLGEKIRNHMKKKRRRREA